MSFIFWYICMKKRMVLYTIEFFRDVVFTDANNLLESRNLQKRFFQARFARENLDLPANQMCGPSLDLARKAKMISWAGNFFKNLQEAHSALVHIRFVEHLMLAFSRSSGPKSLHSSPPEVSKKASANGLKSCWDCKQWPVVLALQRISSWTTTIL